MEAQVIDVAQECFKWFRQDFIEFSRFIFMLCKRWASVYLNSVLASRSLYWLLQVMGTM